MGTRGSNEYPQSMFGAKIRNIGIPPVYPSSPMEKVGFKGVFIARTCFPDGCCRGMLKNV